MKPASISKLGQGVKELAQALLDAYAKEAELKHDCACCEIPETACPPRCVGEVEWAFGRGAKPEATILVRNVGLVTRTFNFSATPLIGLEPGTATLKVEPASASLAPGKTVLVRVKLEDSAALQACQDYRAEVLIRGSWEQCVSILCRVVRDPFDSTQVEQSDSIKEKAFHGASKATLHWEFDRGVTPSAKVTVHNTSKTTATFHFEMTALVGPDTPSTRVTVTPDSIRLGADQSSVVRLELPNTLVLSPGQTYDSDLLINGFYKQRIEVRSSVRPDPAGYVEVEQGEAPTHIHAHRWYDHFQCTVACTTPIS